MSPPKVRFNKIFGATLLAFVALALIVAKLSSNPEGKKVRIAFNSKSSVTKFDPAKIQQDVEAVVLDNLFSPLVRVGVDGTIEPFFAEHYEWSGNTLHLKIRKNLRTIDGWLITARDAEFSLKRILLSKTNAHGNLSLFLCPDETFKNIGSKCSGIESSDDELKLTVIKSSFKPFLLNLLSSMDFGVIPKAACNLDSADLEIKDYRNTSGPYFVSKDDPKGAFELSKNPNHWLAETGIPDGFQFIPSSPNEAIAKMKAGEVDYISCINVDPSMVGDLRQDSNLNIFETYPIRKFIVASSHSRLKQFSVSERLAIHQRIRNAFTRIPESQGWAPSIDFYPPSGVGSLTSSQSSQLKAMIADSAKTRIHRKIVVAAGASRVEFVKAMLSEDNDFEVVSSSNMAPFMPEAERPDFYIAGTDSAFLESFGLVSYSVLAEQVDMTKAESEIWLTKYLSLEEKTDRVVMINELNARTLMKGVMGILGESPYIHITRKPFRYAGSKYFAGSALWYIRRD